MLKLVLAALLAAAASANRDFPESKLAELRARTSAMFHHAYSGYLAHAHPYDELRPLSCDGVDTWGSYRLTLVDALDTLLVVGNETEFRRVYRLLADGVMDFDADINVSVFETNIRILGGLLSGHLFAHQGRCRPSACGAAAAAAGPPPP